jgi:hypothetical protein
VGRRILNPSTFISLRRGGEVLLTLKVNELDIVLLKNGRRGTVVHVYELPLGRLPAYVVELLPGDGDLVTVEHGEIGAVLVPFVPVE